MAWKRGSSRSGSRSGSTLAWFNRLIDIFAKTGPSNSSAASVTFRIARKAAGKVIAHVHVVWINQQGTINPFLGAFGFAKDCKSTNPPARNRSIVRILRENLFRLWRA